MSSSPFTPYTASLFSSQLTPAPWISVLAVPPPRQLILVLLNIGAHVLSFLSPPPCTSQDTSLAPWSLSTLPQSSSLYTAPICPLSFIFWGSYGGSGIMTFLLGVPSATAQLLLSG